MIGLKLKRTSLVDDVIGAFIKDVQDRKFKHGEKLPSQKELANYYEVSLIVLREALSKLSAIGMISFQQGKGTYLNIGNERSPITPEFSNLIFHDITNLRAIIEARQIIEKETSLLAAKRRTEEDLIEIKVAINGMRDNFHSSDTFAKWDLEFHIAVAKASKNPVILKVLYLLIDSYRKEVHKFFQIPDVVQKVFREHESIFHSIRDGNGEEASSMMHTHFELPEQIFKLMMEKK